MKLTVERVFTRRRKKSEITNPIDEVRKTKKKVEWEDGFCRAEGMSIEAERKPIASIFQ